MLLTGRKIIIAPYKEIDETNVIDILKNALNIHLYNKECMDYLTKYHKGVQPILNRVKEVRPEINNKIVINYAKQITSFKSGYLLWKPIQMVARREEVDEDKVIELNDFCSLDNKEIKDKRVANLQSINGTAYKFAKPNPKYEYGELDEAPYITDVVDPRMAFCIYSSELGNKQIGGVVLDYTTINGKIVWTLYCYTDTKMFKVIAENGVWTFETFTNVLGEIPLIEYPLNEERIGDFEAVISILDAINLIESNRVDGVEQYIQALMIFKNVDISAEDFKELKDMGAIKIKDNTDGTKVIEANVSYLNQELNQEQVQKLKDDMWQGALEIVGMPSQSSGNTSDSSNNGSTILKNGWYSAEARATDTETYFKGSERKMLKIIFKICNILTLGNFKLSIRDVDIKFTRRNYEDILAKAQVLTSMLQTGKVAPRLAFQVCGLFSDPDSASKESDLYVKMTAEEIAKKAIEANGGNDNA